MCALERHTIRRKSRKRERSRTDTVRNKSVDYRRHHSRSPSRIRVGTDFSGLETPSIILKRCQIPMKLKFACEKDTALLKMLVAEHTPKVIFEDISKRCVTKVPRVDLYISGSSCQPYSTIGKGCGRQDRVRGNHLALSVKYICQRKPRVAVLENVRGLLMRRHKATERERERHVIFVKWQLEIECLPSAPDWKWSSCLRAFHGFV